MNDSEGPNTTSRDLVLDVQKVRGKHDQKDQVRSTDFRVGKERGPLNVHRKDGSYKKGWTKGTHSGVKNCEKVNLCLKKESTDIGQTTTRESTMKNVKL